MHPAFFPHASAKKAEIHINYLHIKRQQDIGNL